MTTVLALPRLYEDVQARFTADAAPSTPVTQSFGWREPARHAGERRIIWVPGDEGDLGDVGAPRNPGRNPRSLGTLHERFTVFIEAVDTTTPENEQAQYTAARLLLDAWLRAVYLAAHGAYEIHSVRWVNDKNLRRYGAAIRVVASIESMVPDTEYATAPTDASANVTSFASDDPADPEGEIDVVSAA